VTPYSPAVLRVELKARKAASNKPVVTALLRVSPLFILSGFLFTRFFLSVVCFLGLSFDTEDRGTVFLRNVDDLPDYKLSHLKN
jgi:hypothetical protein